MAHVRELVRGDVGLISSERVHQAEGDEAAAERAKNDGVGFTTALRVDVASGVGGDTGDGVINVIVILRSGKG